MRFLHFIVIFVCLFTSNIALSQSITYKTQGETTANILQEICKQAGYQISFNSDIFDNKKYSFTFNNTDFTTCISSILGRKYNYKVVGKQVIVTEAPKENKEQTPPTKPNNKQNKIVTIYDTIPVYDTITHHKTITETVFVTDTIPFVDTITMKRYETNYLHIAPNCISISASIGIGMNNIQFYDKTSYASSLQEIHQKGLGFKSQIDATYKRKNLLFSTGLSLYNCRIINSYKTTYYTDDPSFTYKDTIWYWDYKNIMTYYKFNNGDSVAIQVLDSTYTYTIRENQKKIEHTKEKLSTLSWHYISIPIGLGFHCNLTNTISIEPSVALQAHILLKSQGEIPTEDRESTYKVKDLLTPINYSATIYCNFLYSLEKQYSVSIKPWYSITPSILQELGCKAYVSHWGLVWGFHYTIPYDLF
ncbi:MAG: hypothetical protein MJ204_06100 [Bacteroidales bacterium]|nr:hypothetical protein [Bacteroidales bacterium]